MKRSLTIISALLLASVCAFAQKEFGSARFDNTVYDFGRVNTKDGAVRCSFSVTNIGDEPLNIFAVTTTCSCTNVVWTRKEIAPGEAGTIDVSYSNDEGPYPFDKALNVYLSCMDRPVILHVKGTAYTAKKKKCK
ncbi:MAG: DUF1573 domain-containing protein [Bacteroidales bacterium]|nr:DUF1573 domain-containing protein [Bacteroidales bacterium]